MANVPSNEQYMNDVESAQDAPLSEALIVKFAGTVNGLLDDNTTNKSNIATNTSNIAALSSKLSFATGTLSSTGTHTVFTATNNLVAAFVADGSGTNSGRAATVGIAVYGQQGYGTYSGLTTSGTVTVSGTSLVLNHSSGTAVWVAIYN